MPSLAAALLTAGAGSIHLWHAGSQEGQLRWFFLAVGAVQCGLGLGLVIRPRVAAWPALFLNGGLMGLYFATHLPFSSVAEPLDAKGVTAKFLEAGSMLLIAATFSRLRSPGPDAVGEVSGPELSRRNLLRIGSLGAASVVAGGALSRVAAAQSHHGRLGSGANGPHIDGHFGNLAKGEIDTSRFDPMAYLKEFDYGKVTKLPDGRTLREFTISSVDLEIEVAPGVKFPAWTYNGRVPGPTLRATQGDLVKVQFSNAGSHPHTIHFHGFHAAKMDGVFEQVQRGETFTYEFTAEPFGLHLYHCHTPPLKRHIHKGLYGVFIVDPPEGRTPANEMVMMMNGFDTNLDGENEVYAVNTVAHYYARNPIRIRRDELVRIYLVNITEFDPINGIHIHATFFNEYRTGTKLEPDNFTDTIILGQGERSILEFSYRSPGRYMFHAHISEFAELGWMSIFEVVP